MHLINSFYKSVFPFEKLQQARNNSVLFRDCVILIFRNDVVVELNKSLLTKLPEDVYIYNSIDSVDISKDGIDYIP